MNSKCIGKGIDPEVKIIQKFDALNIPQIHTHLLRHFRLYLTDLDIKNKAEIRRNKIRIDLNNSTNTAIPYVEKLLGIQLENHRKFAISLILAPYFVNVQGLSDGDSFSKIKQWVLRCNEIRKLEPTVEYFDSLIKTCIERVKKHNCQAVKV